MHVEGDLKCMQTNFGGHGLSGFGDIATSQIWPNFPFGPWTIVHGGQKIESAQKFMQVEGDMKCMQNQFWWTWPLWFWRYCYFPHLLNILLTISLCNGLCFLLFKKYIIVKLY